MRFTDTDTPAAFYTQTSLPCQQTNCHIHKQPLTHLTWVVQSTESCWAASLQGILGRLLCQPLIGNRNCLCCRLIGGCCLGCDVTGDRWGLQTCGEDAEVVKAHGRPLCFTDRPDVDAGTFLSQIRQLELWKLVHPQQEPLRLQQLREASLSPGNCCSIFHRSLFVLLHFSLFKRLTANCSAGVIISLSPSLFSLFPV